MGNIVQGSPLEPLNQLLPGGLNHSQMQLKYWKSGEWIDCHQIDLPLMTIDKQQQIEAVIYAAGIPAVEAFWEVKKGMAIAIPCREVEA